MVKAKKHFRVKDRYTESHAKYYPLIFNVVFTKLGNIDDTCDICQEIFFKFYEKFEEIDNHRKWLYGAMRISLLNFYKSKSGRDVPMEEVFNDIGLTFVNGFRELRVILAEFIDNPESFESDDDKSIFDFVAIYNYSYSETGKELGFTNENHGISRPAAVIEWGDGDMVF